MGILKITIPSQGEQLTDFPICVKLSTSSGVNQKDISDIFSTLTDANRLKIKIYESTGTTQLYVEIKEWSSVSKFAVLFIKVPVVKANNDTVIYLHYDTSFENNTSYVGDTNSTAGRKVWTNGYVGVWHTSSGSVLYNSIENANHGTISGATVVNGPIGKCLSYDGVDDYVSVSNNAKLNFNGISGFTISAKFVISSFPTKDWADIISKGDYDNYGLSVHSGGHIRAPIKTSSVVDVNSVLHILNTNTDYFVDVICKVNNNGEIYINGAYNRDRSLASGSFLSTTNALRFGNDKTEFFKGKISFLSLSSVVRSPAWIAATNLSLRDELIFYGYKRPTTSVVFASANPMVV